MGFSPIKEFVSLALVCGWSLGGYHLAPGHRSGTVKLAVVQERPKDTMSNCAPTLRYEGKECPLLGWECNEQRTVCVCSYNCESPDDEPDQLGPPDFTGFDNLSIDRQKAALSNGGPLIPPSFDMNDISMRVFVRADWPFYVSYSLNEGSAILTITADDIEPFSQALQAGKKRQEILKIPERFGLALRVARISLKAPLDSQLELHAIGILEKDNSSKNHHLPYRIPAAAREPISDVTVTPNRISTDQQEKISYWFFSRALYSSGAAEFFSFKFTSKNEIVPLRVYSSYYENIKANEKTKMRQWDGRNLKGQFSFGIHRLQIRTWRGQGKGGEWFGPYYGPKVEVVH